MPEPMPLDPSVMLSSREAEVLELAALGLTNHEIARRLEVTVHAVKFHLSGVYRKLGVNNRTEAVVRWLLVPAAAPALPALEETG